jgi:hypothetical protein
LPLRESTSWASSSPPPAELLHGPCHRSRPPLPFLFDAIVIRASFWCPGAPPFHPVALGRSRTARRRGMSPRRRGWRLRQAAVTRLRRLHAHLRLYFGWAAHELRHRSSSCSRPRTATRIVAYGRKWFGEQKKRKKLLTSGSHESLEKN